MKDSLFSVDCIYIFYSGMVNIFEYMLVVTFGKYINNLIGIDECV